MDPPASVEYARTNLQLLPRVQTMFAYTAQWEDQGQSRPGIAQKG